MTTTLLGLALFVMLCAARFLYMLWSDASDDVEALEDLILYLDSECHGYELSIAAGDALREQAIEIRESAFPTLDYIMPDHVATNQEGMTLRDYFAAKALQGICAGGPTNNWSNALASEAYALADAMLVERSK